MTDDGEKGKHSKINKGPNPLLSTQLITLCTCSCSRIVLKIRLRPSLRMIKKTPIEPRLEPTQDNKNPLKNPYVAAITNTTTNMDRKGRKASININKNPSNDPNYS